MKFTKIITILTAFSLLYPIKIAIAQENQSRFNGTLKIGQRYSYVFYFGQESGDTVIYFFETNSPVGKKITSVCKNNNPCSGLASLATGETNIPREIPESTSGTYRIISVSSVSSPASVRSNGAGIGYSSNKDVSFCSTTLTSKQSGSRINIRQGPGSNYAIQHYGISGDKIDILNDGGNPNKFKSARDREGDTWYQIGFPKSRAYGWIRADFLNLPPTECRN
jgi:hypothetical protein